MEDTAKNDKDKLILETAKLLEEHKARDVAAIDVQGQNSWTDYFILATANSQGHMRGLLKNVRSFLVEQNVEFKNKYKHIDDFTWLFIDCGFMVIHLMDDETREFYDLEKLWFNGRSIYSSKSS
ncbi:MAG: ribosome silencing factor [Spirochaetales bacterium]|uniref:Ribosomal silencing factor RsfS n=1 Tax=Candidatus Thalassospirochaeta sargassi TaxID=3119039 RepID=A0AAJ1IGW7_9SPIO|nr:ribosome silencing factor [Spirochaetales bacterium]